MREAKETKLSFDMIETDKVYIHLDPDDKRVRHASDLALNKDIFKSDRPEKRILQPNELREKMLERATAYAARIGVRLDANYKYWEGPSGVPKGNYHPKQWEWSFLWHRFHGAYPIWNECLILHLDDETGKLRRFNNSVSDRQLGPELKPSFPLEEARAKAIKYWVAKHPGSRYQDPKQAKMGIYQARTMLFYYVQKELRPEKLKLLKNPEDDHRLRLCHGIYVGCWFAGEEDKPMRILDVVMVDAVTGEEVVRNPID